MDVDVENLEGEASDSEASIWSVPKDTWNKDTDDWSSPLPETKLVPYQSNYFIMYWFNTSFIILSFFNIFMNNGYYNPVELLRSET